MALIDKAEKDESAALRALNQSEYAAKWNLFESLAKSGSPKWQVIFGWLHLAGKGVPRTIGAAREWFLRAAEKNYPDGFYYLGELAEQSGLGIEAREHFKAAASLGSAPACYRLGLLFSKFGAAVMPREEAIRWMLEASDRGHEFARILTSRWIIVGSRRGQKWRAIMAISKAAARIVRVVIREGRERAPHEDPLIRT